MAWFVESVAISRNGILLHAWEIKGLQGLISESYLPEPGIEDEFWLKGLWEAGGTGRRFWELSHDELIEAEDPWSLLTPPIRSFLSHLAAC